MSATLEVSTVSDLAAIASGVTRTPTSVAVSDLKIVGSEIRVPGIDPLVLDDLSTEKISKFFGLPASYITKGDADLREWNLNHRFNKEEGVVSLYTLGNDLIGLSDPNKKSLPLGAYLNGIVNNFHPDDKVVEFHNDAEYLHIDVLTDQEVEVLGDGSDRRPAVGDITKAGVRVIAYPDLDKPPVLSTYLHRLVCTNGMSLAEPEAKINLRGKTTEEINQEFESIIANLKIGLGSRLDQYAESANIPIEGEVSHFMYNMAYEHGLSRNVTARVLDLRSLLDDSPSVYDVTQVFTQVANDSVNYRSRLALQNIGGYMVGDPEHALNRCANCQHTFIDYDAV